MTKIVAFAPILYGSCYLGWSIKSVIDHVSEYHVIYSPVGAHGHRTAEPSPDSRDELYAIASAVAGSKLRWHDAGEFAHEGLQREYIHRVAPDADLIIPVDYDEVWQDGLVQLAIETALAAPIQRWRIPFRHYWRSFSKCILHDPAYPVRVIKPSGIGEETLETNGLAVNHLGYAIPPALLEYKWKVHGHHNELRTDVDYFRDIYRSNRQYDCHPVGSEWWNPEDVNPLDFMPAFMQAHPFWGKDVIE